MIKILCLGCIVEVRTASRGIALFRGQDEMIFANSSYRNNVETQPTFSACHVYIVIDLCSHFLQSVRMLRCRESARETVRDMRERVVRGS